MLLLGAGALALSLLGFADRRFWFAELATSLRAQLLLLALLIVGLALVGRSVVGLALGVAGLVVNAFVLAPLYTADPAAASSGARLTLAHVNMQRADVDERSLQEEIERRRPDVLVVLAPPVGWQPSASGYRVLRHPDEPQILVLAGVELRRIRAPHVTLRSSSLLFEVELGGRPVTVLAAHVVAPRSPSEEGVRDSQLRTFGRWARGHLGPEIVLGDMNATPWSSAIADLEEAAELRNSARGFGFQATWPASLGSFGVPIDQLLHSAELTVVDRDVGPSFGSDHRSLWATVALAASS